MAKILFLYYSGAGSTQTIVETLHEILEESHEIEVSHIDSSYDYSRINKFDLTVFGFPTYACKPPLSMREFIENMPVFEEPQKAIIFTTYALYQENCLKSFAESLKEKNILVNESFGLKAPATDGSLILPASWNFLYTYENKAVIKLKKMITVIESLAESNQNQYKEIKSKWYSALNEIFIGSIDKNYDKIKNELDIIQERCINCNTCINDCPRGCWSRANEFPEVDVTDCELCLKCVHHCPTKAIIFTEKMKDRQRLNHKFYNELKDSLVLEIKSQ